MYNKFIEWIQNITWSKGWDQGYDSGYYIAYLDAIEKIKHDVVDKRCLPTSEYFEQLKEDFEWRTK